MTNLDAAGLAQLARRMQLIDEDQLRECAEELDLKAATPQQLARHLERKGVLTPWQADRLLKGERDGFFLRGYRILYRIAAGSFKRLRQLTDHLAAEQIRRRIVNCNGQYAVVHARSQIVRNHLRPLLSFRQVYS